MSSVISAFRSEGGLLPADFLGRLREDTPGIDGTGPEQYHLVPGERPKEAISTAWRQLREAWHHFRGALEKLPAGDRATAVTRERWLLPLFSTLGFGRLQAARGAVEIAGRSYPISHLWHQVPLHLVGAGVDLDARTKGLAGAATASPHSLLQEYLNRSDHALWGVVSNGLKLRLLRDNATLTRQAYVEFDLEAIFTGAAYTDFALLWKLLHESRFEGERPEECWLERWSKSAREQGVRALDSLRRGVEEAILALGRGFLGWPGNRALRDRLRDGELSKEEYYRQLLRAVYRLILLFAAEDRDLLLLAPGAAAPKARDLYAQAYSTARLRRLAEKRKGSRHPDLWHGLAVVLRALGGTGAPELALPPLGGFLFSASAAPDLDAAEISNRDLLDAVRALAFTRTYGRIPRPVDYRNLGPEELGSVYEALLELHPEITLQPAGFELASAAGNERKTTGSYYTPTALIECLLDSALDPLLDEAMAKPRPEEALLALRVCDPACGSGHFLLAAAHRIARRLASVRSGELEPPPPVLRSALRDVIGHCLYGVDINPMAAELCKVNLWLESLEPGRPLSFLDHHIQVGNSLLGTTPALLAKGIPDEAFTAIEGDDREVVKKFKKINKQERRDREAGQQLFDYEPWARIGQLATSLADLERMPDDTVEQVRAKERRYAELVTSADYDTGRFLADAWCAAFVWKKVDEPGHPQPITESVFRAIERNPQLESARRVRAEVRRLAEEYRFFHWHLAFPDVFQAPGLGEQPASQAAGWTGGSIASSGTRHGKQSRSRVGKPRTRRQPRSSSSSQAPHDSRSVAGGAETCTLSSASLESASSTPAGGSGWCFQRVWRLTGPPRRFSSFSPRKGT
ncbi:MAG: N-6 DNA methylase [Thermoanaerobaculia bacterium]|nr:N-6 DNA methylase [Thermoanaerobaculia bacterium]